MHPDIDSGYTKADLYERYSTYFCLFFARGCCAEGVNCRYYHRIPTIEECEKIDNSKDVFGRSRFANHREDMKGYYYISIFIVLVVLQVIQELYI